MSDEPEQRPCPHCQEILTVSEDRLPIYRRYDDRVWYGCPSRGREAFEASYRKTRSKRWAS